MKQPKKAALSRGGGIAARFAKGGDATESVEPGPANETPPVVSPQKPAAGDPLDYVTPPSPTRKVRARIIEKPVANVANKRRYDKWREANPELYKERQRELMRKRRAADKAAKDAK